MQIICKELINVVFACTRTDDLFTHACKWSLSALKFWIVPKHNFLRLLSNVMSNQFIEISVRIIPLDLIVDLYTSLQPVRQCKCCAEPFTFNKKRPNILQWFFTKFEKNRKFTSYQKIFNLEVTNSRLFCSLNYQ